jgi:chaperone modulatory protein CbpM
METHEFFQRAPIDDATLEQWVEAGWLVHHGETSGQPFSDIDIARAHLIRDLQDLGANDDGIPIILDLVDQLHGLRHLLRELLVTVNAQRKEQDPRVIPLGTAGPLMSAPHGMDDVDDGRI